MKLLDPHSLAGTLDAVNHALFFSIPITADEAQQVASWLADRQGIPGSYAGMFAPTLQDFSKGIQLFTGERISSQAATGHILGEETCRVLLLLDVDMEKPRLALGQATRSMDERLNQSERENGKPGFF